jgi:hypothetical protein
VGNPGAIQSRTGWAHDSGISRNRKRGRALSRAAIVHLAAPMGMMEALRNMPALADVFLISGVPLLGPRLSLAQPMMSMIPSMQKYEDDLRDQWQSRAHRAEWRRMLSLCLDVLERSSMTVRLSKIHLAAPARTKGPERDLIQLIASGIAHYAPPQGYARAIGLLACLGAAPLPRHAIWIEPLPGQSQHYVAGRTYLVVTRNFAKWSAE